MTAWQLSKAYIFEGRMVLYEVRGKGPAVVMVHGTPWSSFNFRHLIDALSTSFTVYYYDLLGYGLLDKSPGNVSLGIQNQVLLALLAHWQIERPVIIGHDFDGATVLRTHLINGRDFAKIVLIDPVERGEALRDMIQSSVLRVIPDAGHLVIREKPACSYLRQVKVMHNNGLAG